MTIDRNIWLGGFSGTGPTPWPCGRCNGARLHVVSGSLQKQETSDSIEAHSELAFEPDWIDGRFVCMLRCPDCENPSAVAGTYSVAEKYIDVGQGEPEPHRVDTLWPRFFSEPPPIIRAPAGVPAAVTEELENSFRLYWQSPEASANSMRSVVERVLTHFKIRQWTGGKKGKRSRLQLHDRIEMFRKKHEALANALMAVKWIGNAGSHALPVEQKDVLVGYELLEHVLEELFRGGRHKRIAQMSRKVNKRKGPLSAKRGRSVKRGQP